MENPECIFQYNYKNAGIALFTTYKFSLCLNDYCLIDIAIISASK